MTRNQGGRPDKAAVAVVCGDVAGPRPRPRGATALAIPRANRRSQGLVVNDQLAPAKWIPDQSTIAEVKVSRYLIPGWSGSVGRTRTCRYSGVTVTVVGMIRPRGSRSWTVVVVALSTGSENRIC